MQAGSGKQRAKVQKTDQEVLVGRMVGKKKWQVSCSRPKSKSKYGGGGVGQQQADEQGKGSEAVS